MLVGFKYSTAPKARQDAQMNKAAAKILGAKPVLL